MSRWLTSTLSLLLTTGEFLLPLAALGLAALALAPGIRVAWGLRLALLTAAVCLAGTTAAVPWIR